MVGGTSGTLATMAGVALAGLLVAAGLGLLRLWRALRGLLRRPQRVHARQAAWRRGARLRRSRALARSEAARAEALERELRRLRAELRLARAERDRALARAEGAVRRGWRFGSRGTADDDRFLRAKRAFALRFHPDRVPRDTGERRLREAMFREHWQELQRIERG